MTVQELMERLSNISDKSIDIAYHDAHYGFVAVGDITVETDPALVVIR